MAEKLRIKKLATRLGISPEEVLQTLHRLGETKYRTPSDMLADEVVQKLEKALTEAGLVQPPRKRELPAVRPKEEPPPPPPMPSFLLARTRPVSDTQVPDVAPESSSPGPAPLPPEPEASAPSVATPSPSPPAPPDLSAASEDEHDLASIPVPEPTPEPEVEPEPPLPPAVAERMAGLQSQVTELTQALEETRKKESAARALQQIAIDRLAPSEMKVQALQQQLTEQDAAHTAAANLMQQQLNRAEASLRASEAEEVAKVVARRGIEAAEDIYQLVALLMQGEWQRRTLEHLRIVDGERLLRLLKQKVTVWCGDPRCRLPEGNLGLVVTPASRCEICQGREIVRLAERLVLQCRAKSIRRIVLVGGQAREVNELMKAVSGRLELRWIQPGTSRTETEATRDVEDNHLTVLWTGGELPYRMARVYADLPGVRQVTAAGITGFLDELHQLLS